MVDLEAAAKGLASGVGIVGSVFAGWKMVIRPVKQKMGAAIVRVTNGLDSIEAVKTQVFPNGGSSMLDILTHTRTEVQRAATLTAVNSAFVRALADESAIGVFDADPSGRVIAVNNPMTTLLGMTDEQARGNGWLGAVVASEREQVSSDWESAVKRGESFVVNTVLQSVTSRRKVGVRIEATPVRLDERSDPLRRSRRADDPVSHDARVMGWVGKIRPTGARR